MKNRYSKALPAALAVIACAATPIFAQDNVDPLTPVGTLDAYPAIVKTGTHPTLTWAIQYPETLEQILTKDNVCAAIRVVGASVVTGYDEEGGEQYAQVQADVNIGDGNWVTFFQDSQDNLVAGWVYANAGVVANTRPQFRGRTFIDGGWTSFETTGSGSTSAVILTDGDPLPTYVPAIARGDIESYLAPYVDNGGNVKIGPKEMLILFELETADRRSPKYNLQDLVVLTSIDYCKNNNGHGNNIDGVDVSNPGKSKDGEDSDTTIDDEIKGGVIKLLK